MEVITTVCGDTRLDASCCDVELESAESVLARHLYRDPHTIRVRRIATRRKLPFFYFSGKLGFLGLDASVQPGSFQLLTLDTPELVPIISEQCEQLGITRVEYYPQPDPRLYLYGEVLKYVTESTDIAFAEHMLAPQPA